MGHRGRAVSALATAVASSVLMAGSTLAQHGPTEGHLLGTGASGKLELVGQVGGMELNPPVTTPDLIADVGVDPDGNYAYLANWGAGDCAGPETGGKKKSPDAGIYVIDISDPANPKQVNFIPMHQDTRPGEGVHIVNITTSKFSGDILALNEETCGKNYKAGFSLWDVTNPLEPKKLAQNVGDFTVNGARKTPHDANETHSVFIWDAGARAYLVAQDEWETLDVDIFDITDPKHPRLITELDLNAFNVNQPDLGLTDSFLHDMIVKRIGNRFIMLLSYWDGGFVLLDVTNPATPVFLGDSDYTNPDPQLLRQLGVGLTPEGNAHQAEFTIDNRFVIGTDEDFDPYRLNIQTDDGGSFLAKPGTQTTAGAARGIRGQTIFVGLACDASPAVPTAPNVGTAQIAVVERGICTFEEKVENVVAAGGYEAVIIFNREGAGNSCLSVFGPFLTVEGIPVAFVGRDAGLAFFDRTFNLAECLDATPTESGIPIGTLGDVVTGVTPTFDGWGYVHLYAVNLATGALTEVDTLATTEAFNYVFAEGFGDLTVHEVAVDPQDPSLAYLSYYSSGVRVIQIECGPPPSDVSTCKLVAPGGYLSPQGNDFWGVETFVVDDGQTYILASDRDYGLFIFRDP